MGAARREGNPRRLEWWQQTLDYMDEEEGEEAGSAGGLRWLSTPRPLATHTTAPSRPPRAGAPLAAMVASGAVGQGGVGGIEYPLDGGVFP